MFTGTAGALAATGAIIIVVAVAAQQRAPQPALAVDAVAPAAVRVTVPALEPEPDPVATSDQVVGPVLASSTPVAIDIPAIEVHSELQRVGMTADRRVEVPAPGPLYDVAAWYEHSATPGALGPAVILGHVDSATSGPSVFFELGELQRGDEVTVTRADGTVAAFRVDEVRRYPKTEFPTQLVYGATDHAALRLITCGGVFDEAAGSYRDNVIVFASLVGSRDAV